ncbi:MAG: DoxX family membrane protein [bacterium]|nr:DoxX family membrane protein [bacterium]
MDKEKVVLVMRLLLGLIFLVFGLNGFFSFLQMPPMPEEAMSFLGGLMGAGYFFPVLKVTEIICGALLLAGIYVPLALVVLAPVILNIVLFHLFLAPGGMLLPVVILILELGLAYHYRSAWDGVLQKKADIS